MSVLPGYVGFVCSVSIRVLMFVMWRSLVGRHAGQAAGFKYTEVNQKKAIVWAEEMLLSILRTLERCVLAFYMSYTALTSRVVHPWYNHGLFRL